MAGNENIEAALDNLWDVVNEEGYEIGQFDHDTRLPDGAVEIARAHGRLIGVGWDTRICVIPAQAKERHYDVDN